MLLGTNLLDYLSDSMYSQKKSSSMCSIVMHKFQRTEGLQIFSTQFHLTKALRRHLVEPAELGAGRSIPKTLRWNIPNLDLDTSLLVSSLIVDHHPRSQK